MGWRMHDHPYRFSVRACPPGHSRDGQGDGAARVFSRIAATTPNASGPAAVGLCSQTNGGRPPERVRRHSKALLFAVAAGGLSIVWHPQSESHSARQFTQH